MSLSKVTLSTHSWVGVPSRQHRRHWKVVRWLVLDGATDDVLAVTRRIRACRRTNGWRPRRAMEVAAAEQNVYELIYLLVDQEVYTDMLLWALDRAATGQWRVPSINEHNSLTMRDVALRLLDLETERGYTRAFEERVAVGDASCCWEEGLQGPDFAADTEQICEERVYYICKNPLAQ
jgi:hypothetical protein